MYGLFIHLVCVPVLGVFDAQRQELGCWHAVIAIVLSNIETHAFTKLYGRSHVGVLTQGNSFKLFLTRAITSNDKIYPCPSSSSLVQLDLFEVIAGTAIKPLLAHGLTNAPLLTDAYGAITRRAVDLLGHLPTPLRKVIVTY